MKFPEKDGCATDVGLAGDDGTVKEGSAASSSSAEERCMAVLGEVAL